MNKAYKKLRVTIILALLLIFGLSQYFGVIVGPDNLIYDNLLSSPGEPSDNIIIIGMDERSINEIGSWPWPRFYVADAIEKLAEYDVAAISASILYDAYSNEDYDNALVKAAALTERLVLGGMAYISDEGYNVEIGIEDYISPFDELDRVVTTGFLNAENDGDGVMRRALTSLRYGDTLVHSLAYETYLKACEVKGITPNEVPVDNVGTFPINYTSRPGGYKVYSFWALINDELEPAIFKDAIVLIGPYAQGIGGGNYPTPLEKATLTYGVEINANIIQNMFEGDFKESAPQWLNFGIMAASVLIMLLLLHRLKPLWSVALTLGLAAILIITALIAYSQFGIIIKCGDTIILLLFCWLTNMIFGILTAQNEKQHIQGLFGRFVAPEVVNEIISGGVDIQLGGSEKEITVLFVDIRGFTAFSEANPPEKVVKMVNRYLDLTSRSIQSNGGTIDKFIGDATMAMFNAPNELAEHALCAVKAAWAMKVGSQSLREEILQQYEVDLQFGVGINTGNAVVGNMGSDFRMDYTAIGDTVNTAARLESNAQKGQIIISEATYKLVKDHVEVTDLGILMVKNKKTGIQIYSVDDVL
ncbi:MAG: adenylate/guanylate cyclase domain-containing protein [Oscillospiraceae bacterium]|nr:adenylate/guanylate cyclase domain-containing protein [Oscillospiraceae bacterium]